MTNTSSNNIKFISQSKDQSAFFTTLSQRVNNYFTENNLSKKANAGMILKTIILFSVYIIPFVLILAVQPSFWISMALWFLMGIGMAGVGMNVMHDANHGAYTSKQIGNKILGFSLNLLGGSIFNWNFQHNVLHHTYTNITGWDEDINTKGVLNLSPHLERKKFHRLQWLYAILIYNISTLYWTIAKDFIQFNRYTKDGISTNTPSQNIKSVAALITMKLIYFSVLLVVPTLVFNIPFLSVLAGFLLMNFVCGIILSVVFQLAHTVEGTTHPLPNAEGNIENAWAVHQLQTTSNFARNNRLVNWYVGGLNFQVEHHLFTHICHVHYPKIAPIVKETASEFGIPYHENETFTQAIKSHFRLLKQFGTVPNLNELIG